MALINVYSQNFENNALTFENPDNWFSNRPRAATRIGPGGTSVITGSYSMGANVEAEAPEGAVTVTLSRTFTGLTAGRKYVFQATSKSRITGSITNIRLGFGATYSTSRSSAAIDTLYSHTLNFTATGSSHTLTLNYTNSTSVGTLLVWDDINLYWDQPEASVAPTVTANPVNNFVTDQPQTFSWNFNGNNTGDYQTARQFLIKANGATILDTGKVLTGSTSYNLASNTLGSGTFTWQVRAWDSTDLVSPYTAEDTFDVVAANVQPSASVVDLDVNPGTDVVFDFKYLSNEVDRSDPMSLYEVWVVKYDTATYIGLEDKSYYHLYNTGATSLGGDTYRVTFPWSLFTGVGQTYYIVAQVRDTLGPTASEITWTAFTTPSPPVIQAFDLTGYDVSSPGTLAWSYSETSADGRYTGYQASYAVYITRSGYADLLIEQGVDAAKRSVTLPAGTLIDGIEYGWKLVVTSGTGGQATDTATITQGPFVNHPPVVTLNTIPSFDAAEDVDLTWVYSGGDYNDPQANYHVIVYDANNAVVWDSGVVESAATSVTVPSGTFTNGTTYTWTVTVEDTRWAEGVVTPGYYELVPAQPVVVTNSGWTQVSGTVTNDYSGKNGGGTAGSLRVVAPTGASLIGIASKTLTGLIVGKSYTITAIASRAGGSYTTPTYVSAGLQIVGGPATVYAPNLNTSTGIYWHNISYTFTASATEHELRLYSSNSSGATTSTQRSDVVFDVIGYNNPEYQVYHEPVYETEPAVGSAQGTFTSNFPPNPPVLTHRTDFIAQSAVDFSWTFTDPNTDGAQSAYQIIFQKTADESVAYDSGKVMSSAKTITLPADTLDGGTEHRWQVYVWDQHDFQSAPSNWDTFTTAADIEVTITTPIEGQVLDTNTVEVAWTYETIGSSTQTHRRVRVVDVNTNTVHSDTTSEISTAQSYTVTGLTSDHQYRIEVSIVSSAGVPSNTDTVTILPDYVNPNDPTISLSTEGAAVIIVVTNLAATGLRPEVVRNEIWRAPVIGLDAGQFIKLGEVGPNGTFEDYLVGAGSSYKYFVRGVS